MSDFFFFITGLQVIAKLTFEVKSDKKIPLNSVLLCLCPLFTCALIFVFFFLDWIVFIVDGVDQYSMTSSRRTFLAISSSFAQVMVGHQHHFHFQQKICSQTIFYEWVDLTQLQAMKFFQLLGNGVGFINKTSDLCIIVSLSRPVFSLFVQPEPDWTRPGHQL